jgi:hypothetical protein
MSVIKGPWKNTQEERVKKEFSSGAYKIMHYLQSIEKQENAYKAGIYLVLYILNQDYSRTFLLQGTEEETIKQLTERKNSSEVEKIKAKLVMYF